VKIGKKYGFIDANGAYTVNPQYTDLGEISDGGLAYARLSDGKYGFINSSGDFVIEASYEAAGNFSLGLAPVKKDGLWGYIDKEGKEVIGFDYTEASEFYSEGYAVADDALGAMMLIDTTGTNVLGENLTIDEIMHSLN